MTMKDINSAEPHVEQSSNSTDETRFAPKGKMWVCVACGKISPYDRHGDDCSTRGWDVSCVLNSALYDEAKVIMKSDGDGRWRATEILE